MKLRLLSLTLGLTFLLSACGSPPPGELLQSSKARLPASAVPEADVHTAATDIGDFGFSLYRELRKTEPGNIVLSPYSLSTVLTMTYAGARTQTETEMAQALHLSLSQERVHAAQNGLSAALTRASEGAKKPFTLSSFNTLWGHKDLQVQPAFLDTLAENYGAGMRVLDFRNETERSRQAINAWVSSETNQRIPELLPQGSIQASTLFVLTNAVYFNATWQTPFKKESTAAGTFHTLAGGNVSVQMMHGQAMQLRYAEHDGLRALELPYDGGKLSMLVVLPAEGAFSAAEGAFTAASLGQLAAALQPTAVNVTMPKLELRGDIPAADLLQELGMKAAFTDQADFSGIDGMRDIAITYVVQKTFVAVDEEGTEAAAASGVVGGPTSIPSADVNFVVDRPFFFFIRDNATGLPLFVGGVVNPS